MYGWMAGGRKAAQLNLTRSFSPPDRLTGVPSFAYIEEEEEGASAQKLRPLTMGGGHAGRRGVPLAKHAGITIMTRLPGKQGSVSQSVSQSVSRFLKSGW